MKLVIYNEREMKNTVEFDVFHTVYRWIKDSRWRKKWSIDCITTSAYYPPVIKLRTSVTVSIPIFAALTGRVNYLAKLAKQFRVCERSVELLPGNFVNSQIAYNLGDNSVANDEKLQLITKIFKEHTLCLEANQINEQNLVPQCRQVEKVCEPRKKDDELLGSRFGEIRDMNSKHEMQVFKNEGYVLENRVEIFDPQFQGFGGLSI
ncbi:hypothetical protein Acr_17g0003930 [Actinidia rufa]|uniref:Uncharacterized protein n=1 Tax=Actinidia rufa TaxID=165716 RepID=A0A7J0G216_9ERIC|nr:hypothetical protein Acr_17g0003930 [Actinidia rufa]